MKNRKGFTLIELLAVIVILAVIMVIAVPKILDVIEDSRMQAFGESASLMVDAVRLKKGSNMLNGQTNYEATYTFEGGQDTSTTKLNVKGELPDNGVIKVDKDGKVALALLSKNKKYCATKEYNEEVEVKKSEDGICQINNEIKAIVPDEFIKEYTITFDTDGGSQVQNITEKPGKVISLPTTTKTNLIFDGWYTSKTGGTKITSNIMPNSSVTYYAHFIDPYGLYDSNNNQVASWSELVSNYGLDIEKNYTTSTYSTETTSAYNVFNGSQLSSGVKLIIPNDLQIIGNYAFYKCAALEIVTIGNSVASIGTGAFYDSTNLKSINVNSNNLYYSSSDGVLFDKNKTKLIAYPEGKIGTTYVIPSTVNAIDAYSFGNSSVTSLTIPNDIKYAILFPRRLISSIQSSMSSSDTWYIMYKLNTMNYKKGPISKAELFYYLDSIDSNVNYMTFQSSSYSE